VGKKEKKGWKKKKRVIKKKGVALWTESHRGSEANRTRDVIDSKITRN